MLKNGTEYKDMGQDYYDQRYQNRLIENMKRRAKQFGYELTYIKEQQPVMETSGDQVIWKSEIVYPDEIIIKKCNKLLAFSSAFWVGF